MKIKLLYFISKKQISLEQFCKLNNLKTYQDLLEYCSERDLVVCPREEYDTLMPDLVEKKVVPPKRNSEIKRAPRARRSRKTPDKESVRDNSKSRKKSS